MKLGRLPETDSEYADFGDRLLEMAQNDHCLNINDFALKNLISPKKYKDLCSANSYFAECFDIALGLIGSRLVRLAASGEIDNKLALALLPMYHPEYKAVAMKLSETSNSTGTFEKFVLPCKSCINCFKIAEIDIRINQCAACDYCSSIIKENLAKITDKKRLHNE